MPATNALAPPLTPAEREIVKSYGDWTSFCQAFGLKPWIEDDKQEAKQILKSFVANDAQGN